jgi:hypothetical protein
VELQVSFSRVLAEKRKRGVDEVGAGRNRGSSRVRFRGDRQRGVAGHRHAGQEKESWVLGSHLQPFQLNSSSTADGHLREGVSLCLKVFQVSAETH